MGGQDPFEELIGDSVGDRQRDNPLGSVRVKGARSTVLLDESRYLALRIVKTLAAMVCFAIGIVVGPVGVCASVISVIGSLANLNPGVHIHPMLSWLGLSVWPIATVIGYASISIAVLCTEKYTRDAKKPGVVEITCPLCGECTPLFNKCAECGVQFIFDSDPNGGVFAGMIKIFNLMLSGVWYVILGIGLVFVLFGML
jgi:hypothetical protein